ncbi:hypothetical protein ABZ348_09575 [Streptomyces sp. NPDC005963]|uniref:hypothetical protein n=1 Tax=Streptomyces sp. NPDC005963 TaxID=3156721 RepID=UPI00340A90BA
MSSSTQNSEPRVRRRRAPLVASAMAVLLIAGGGGTYLATVGSSGASEGSDRSAARPPQLSADPKQRAGIAPGEPPPSGTVHYRAARLPAGPERAAVHRAVGTVERSEVDRLAAALGMSGTPRLTGGTWTVGPGTDGSGPLLRVDRKAPGAWTYGAYGSAPSGDDCARGATCQKPDTGTATGVPVSEAVAKKAAAPLLKALGQADARTDARQVRGAVRIVNADPVVGGLPTYGWTTGVEIGADGLVVGGGGRLLKPVKSDEHPVFDAQEALDRLNQGASTASSAGTAECTTPLPGPDASTSDVPCGPPACATPVPLEGAQKPVQPCGTVTPVQRTVTGAVFGLSAQPVGQGQALVPSWLFRVSGGAAVVQPAVEPEVLQEKEEETRPAQPVRPPKPPQKIKPTAPVADPAVPRPAGRIESYAVDGRTLTVTFWGGVCSDYRATAVESGGAVKVRITESSPDPDRVCIALAKQLTETVTLDRPLGDRTVVDAESGGAVERAGSSG